jgi:hypothetical protein
MGNKALHMAEKRLIGLDNGAKAFFEPYADALPMRVLDVLSKLGDLPQLRLIASSLVVIGTFGDNDRLVRAGARMPTRLRPL